MTDWQPIETAPRDANYYLEIDRGYKILLGTDGRTVFAMYWMADWYGDKSRACWMPANLDEEYGSPLSPTHWMPLPEPPNA